MQTVILLGIIAGLSISFFKKIDSSEKLYNATVVKLKDVIAEVDRQMCNAPTLVCFDYTSESYVEWTDNCSTVYQGARYEPQRERCEAPASDPCPGIVTGSTCKVAISAASQINCDSLSAATFQPMVKDTNTNTCWAPKPCLSYQKKYGNDINNQFDTAVLEALPLNNAACPYNIPNYNVMVTRDGRSYSLFCVTMHDLLPHKLQGTTEADDLRNTCAQNNTAFRSQLNPSQDENLGYYVRNIITAFKNYNPDSDEDNVEKSLDKYNLRLPNGVTIYNLGGAVTDRKNIFIKYDRIDSAKTAVYGTSMKALRVYNPYDTETDSDGTHIKQRALDPNGEYVDEAITTPSGCELQNNDSCEIDTSGMI